MPLTQGYPSGSEKKLGLAPWKRRALCVVLRMVTSRGEWRKVSDAKWIDWNNDRHTDRRGSGQDNRVFEQTTRF